MAKKKLSDYQKARRQFVQQRTAAKGGDVTKEQKQDFRKRFDVLASTKQGRTQLAQRALPNAPQEDRAAYKRVLATELPARKMGGDGGPKTKAPSYGDYASALSAAQSKIPKKSTASQGPVGNNINTRGGVGFKQYGPQYQPPAKGTVGKAKDIWSNRRNNIIGQGINFPGSQALENFMNPLGSKGPITDWSPKGLAKEIGKEFGEAALLVGSRRPLSSVARKGVGALRLGVRGLGKLFPSGKQPGTNRYGGVGKTPYGPNKDNLSPLALNPGPKSNLSKADFESLSNQIDDYQSTLGNLKSGTTTKSASTKGPKVSTKGTTGKTPTVKINKQGGVGSKKYGPAAPPKPTTTKPAATKGPKVSKEATEDLAYQLAQVKNRFPGATEKDLGFVQQLNRAQTAIEKNAPGSQAYAKWLQNKSTQATLRRLRGK